MIVLLFILGMLAIFAISRYNESNKLFWSLFFSFVGMFAVGTVIGYAIGANNKSKDHQYQVCPTQANATASSSICFLADAMLPSTVSGVTGPAPAGKDYILDATDDLNSSKITAGARDQPLYNENFFNTS